MKSNKVLITGASRGIGRAVAERLHQNGDKVLGLARTFKEPPSFATYSIDLSKIHALAPFYKQLLKEHPEVNTLICNAGKGLFGHLEELSFEQIEETMNLNFLSNVSLIKTFLPQMKKRKCGHIILIGSEAALLGKRKGSIYCASKFALRGFAQALRDECKTSGIRVTLINPGMVRTSFFEELSFVHGEKEEEFIEPEDIATLIETILKGRLGTVFDEINLTPQSTCITFKK